MNVAFIYAIGDNVILKALNLPGVVTALLKDSDGEQYRVAWWSDGQRRHEWVFAFELWSAK